MGSDMKRYRGLLNQILFVEGETFAKTEKEALEKFHRGDFEIKRIINEEFDDLEDWWEEK